MKRVLRSAASVSDAKNGLQSPKQTLANSRPLRRLKDATRKGNKENATTTGKKNFPKNVAQPLQEKNSVPLQPKNDKTTLSSSSARTSKPEKPSPTGDTVPTNAASKPRNRRKQLVDDEKRTGEEIVTETNAKGIIDQPSVTLAPDKSIESVTIRKVKQSKNQQLHSSEKDADRQGDREKSSAQDTLAVDNPTKKTRKNTDEQKVVEKNTTIKPAVPFTTKTRSATKHSGESNVSSLRGTRSRKPKTPTTKTPTTKKPTVTTRSDEKKIKANTPHASNVKVGHNQKKKSAKPVVPKPKTNAGSTAQPDVESTQFVTVRRNRKEQAKPARENDGKPPPKVAVISNVTTRRRRANSQTVAEDNAKDATISKRKRSQSVYEIVPNEKKKMEPKSNVDAIVSPPKKRRITTKEDPKTVGAVTKQQQPELLVNRSSASDSSDQSNASAVPIYKRINSTNNNTVNSGFDFESNSQENTLNGDEETQKVLAKLVADNKAAIAKRKGNRKNGGVTKVKGNTTRSKHIEKVRSVLMNGLKELKTRTTNESASNVTKRRVIPEPPIKSLRKEKIYTNPVIVLDLEDKGSVSAEDSSSYCQKNDKVLPNEQQSILEDDMVDDLVDDIQFDVEVNASIHKLSNLLKSNTTPTETPPKRFAATYTGPGKESTLHQSTPVQIVNAGNASPWRLNSDGVKYPSNVFSRYSECEKSPIKSGDVTKVAAAVRSPAKKPRPPLTKKPLTHKLSETEKPKTLESDIRNAFGFASDDDGDDECYPHRPSLPALNISAIAPHVNASRKKPATLATSTMKSTKDSTETATASSNYFKMPSNAFKMFGSIRAAVQLLKNTQTSVPKPKSQSKISTHFGDASKPSASRGAKMNVNTLTTNKNDATRLIESSETEVTTSYFDKDAPSLFETTWLTADDKPHRSYSRVTKREPKRQKEYKSILTDDESDCGDSVVQKRTKRTKPKDDKHQEELRQFEEIMNSDFMDIDRFEIITERSVSSSNI
ncbi:uncharacterized protein LOC119070556 isoform X2 [Bradysia coprophila]|uniref:uncharacterized protein LOC119070556 isoform X2 n=1 Tax=Bradysia coprophila TaxID=38358 RepID=UPI00187DD3C4|nr:uncharacterized protein LOC119070556 isoform X2 [Bradysia coprophila]